MTWISQSSQYKSAAIIMHFFFVFYTIGCLKTKEGSIVMDKEKILERWAEYIGELFEDNGKEHNVMKKNFAGPSIMKDEVREAMRKMKTGKATGPDGLSIELIEALEEYGIEKVTPLLNEIYDTG